MGIWDNSSTNKNSASSSHKPRNWRIDNTSRSWSFRRRNAALSPSNQKWGWKEEKINKITMFGWWLMCFLLSVRRKGILLNSEEIMQSPLKKRGLRWLLIQDTSPDTIRILGQEDYIWIPVRGKRELAYLLCNAVVKCRHFSEAAKKI